MKQRKYTAVAIIALTVVIALAVAAVAHEGHGEPAMGSIAKVEESTLSLTTAGDETVTFALTGETVFKRGEQEVGREEARPGERAVVRYEEQDDAKIAHEVLLPPAEDRHRAPETPEALVDAFHQALVAGDRETALAYLTPDVVIYESGGAEMGSDEYASHHLGADMEFSAAVERTVVNRQVTVVNPKAGSHDSIAWVLTRTANSGTFRDREIDSMGTETMVLRRTEDDWRIIHIHWSSGTRE